MRIRGANLVGIGFALGSLEHAVGFVLLLFGVAMYGPGYPAWRHAAFTCADALITYLAFRHPQRLFVPLVIFLAEQVVVNGSFAVRAWRTRGEIVWTVPVMLVLISAAIVIAAQERRRYRRTVVLRSQAIM